MKKMNVLAVLMLMIAGACTRMENDAPLSKKWMEDETTQSIVRGGDLRRFVINCQGEEGCPHGIPTCFGTGGLCLDDIVVRGIAAENLEALDEAIANGTQVNFCAGVKYGTIFGTPCDEDIQKKLEEGKYVFQRMESEDKVYYNIVKPQHLVFTGGQFANKVKRTFAVIK